MKSFTEFLNMGGYATYVWGSYGLCMAILIWNVLHARSQAKITIRTIKRRLQQLEEAQ